MQANVAGQFGIGQADCDLDGRARADGRLANKQRPAETRILDYAVKHRISCRPQGGRMVQFKPPVAAPFRVSHDRAPLPKKIEQQKSPEFRSRPRGMRAVPLKALSDVTEAGKPVVNDL